MYCICCKKNNVKPIEFDDSVKKSEVDTLWGREKRGDKTITIDNKMVDNGIIQIISAEYGSSNDGSQFIIAICDGCIEENLNNSNLLYYGDYISPNSTYTIEQKEKSKLRYNRKKNLDDITE